jgi:recombination protein RecT
MSTATTAIAKRPIDNLRALFDKASPAIAEVIPRHLTPERILRITLACVSRTPLLLECTPQSILQAVMVAAQLGLDPTGGVLGEAYLVPYKNKKNNNRREAQLIPGYQGLISLARRSGQVQVVSSYPVFRNDVFDYELGITPKITHKPTLDEDTGDLIAVYAVAHLTDCPIAQVEVMSRSQLDRIRMRSKSPDEGPWATDPIEMCRKTGVRRLSKYLPKSPEFAAGLQLQVDAESGERTNYGDLVQLPDEIIDAEEPEPSKTEQVKAKLKAANDEPPPLDATEIPFE